MTEKATPDVKSSRFKLVDGLLIAMMVLPILAEGGLELVDVEYVKEYTDYYLRVYIDKEGGIDIEDCQELSEKLEVMLDEKDIIPDAYILEVSSPGIDRVLRKPRDLVREQGKAVDVTLYAPMDGKKNLTGVLTGFDGEKFTLDDELTIELSKAAQIRLHIDF